jgi:hypothetical protein
LANALYILKIVMVADILPPGTIAPMMKVELDQMAVFIALFHASGTHSSICLKA